LKRRIVIKEYQNCINIEVKAKNPLLIRIIAVIAAAVWVPVFFMAGKYALLPPWAFVQAGLVYYAFWLFLEKTTIAVFPGYILVAHNYFFLEITGRFFQRDSITDLRKAGDNKRILFEYLGRPETLIAGLSADEAAFIMKFLVFSLSSSEFKKTKK
jgi:uncharacterized membrane protein